MFPPLDIKIPANVVVSGGGGNRTRATFPPLGLIYVLQAEHGGPAKIGWVAAADNLEARIGILQTGHPHRLRVVATEPGTLQNEKALHRKFRDCQLHGEWFEPDEGFVERFPDVKLVVRFERFRHYFVEGWDDGYEHAVDDGNVADGPIDRDELARQKRLLMHLHPWTPSSYAWCIASAIAEQPSRPPDGSAAGRRPA